MKITEKSTPPAEVRFSNLFLAVVILEKREKEMKGDGVLVDILAQPVEQLLPEQPRIRQTA